mgnify:CR=1 FL=1
MILLLDVMETLVYDPFPVEVPAFFGTTLPELLALKDPQAWQRFEAGEYDEATFAVNYFQDRRPLDVEGFKATLAGAYRFLPGIEELLGELQGAGVAMHALSNYPPWYALIEERLGLSRWVSWSYVSCRTGVRKPDPEAFLAPARDLGVAPRECLFVDDRADNCAGAEAVGMFAHHFRDASGLRRELCLRGVLRE